MSLATLYSSNAFLRVTLKTVVFVLSSAAATFCAAAGYGLLKMLVPVMSGAVGIGFAEFFTHSGLTLVFFLLAGTGAYVAKRSVG